MPDLRNRAEHENRIAKALAAIFGSIEAAALARPDAIDWAGYRERLRRELAALLYLLYLDASEGMSAAIAFVMDAAAIHAQALGWASAYAVTLADEILSTVREHVSAAIGVLLAGLADSARRVSIAVAALPFGASLRGTKPVRNGVVFESDLLGLREAFKVAVQAVVSTNKALMIAATEVTRGVTAAEDWVRKTAQAAGLVTTKRWHTENDAKVCPICSPLHNKPEAEWPEKIKPGPPAHPNCRCWLTYEVKR